MSINTLPLSYCTNVHPGRTLEEVESGLDRYTVPLRERFAEPLAAGLWLARPVVTELLADADLPRRFAAHLAERELGCYTLNAFPYGDFHSERVKENVYLPDWSQPERLTYTQDCARVLAALLPEDVEGSISTVPLGFKPFERADDFERRAVDQLLELASFLHRLCEDNGRRIRLAIEPEPFCLLETTGETLSFFERLRDRAASRGVLEEAVEYLGVCYDVCHQAVEFEDVPASLAAIHAAGIRLNKIHITCAIHVPSPADNAEARAALARYVEPRYLHQTMAKTARGAVVRAVDLSAALALHPEGEFAAAEAWRVHFHVPVHAERLGPLETTRPELVAALSTVARLDVCPHLEVETYTWEVLPDGGESNLVEGLFHEMDATRTLVRAVQQGT